MAGLTVTEPRIEVVSAATARDGLVLDARAMSCSIPTPSGVAEILRGVDVQVPMGKTLGIVGESGSGKSMLLRAMLGFAPASATVGGTVILDGRELGGMPPERRRRLVGRSVGVVFQNPMTSLNPVVRVGRQVSEAARCHLGLSRRAARALAIDLLAQVGIPDPARRVEDYPHRFSGGMRQRVMIAMALACEPKLLVADEATTALDVTVQRDILDLLARVQQERDMAMILISHDLNVVAGRADHVAVMYGGYIVEHAATDTLFSACRHRYTEALMAAAPRLDQPAHAKLATIAGLPPNATDAIVGCPFAPRCTHAIDECTQVMPEATVVGGGHAFRCHVPISERRRG